MLTVQMLEGLMNMIAPDDKRRMERLRERVATEPGWRKVML